MASPVILRRGARPSPPAGRPLCRCRPCAQAGAAAAAPGAPQHPERLEFRGLPPSPPTCDLSEATRKELERSTLLAATILPELRGGLPKANQQLQPDSGVPPTQALALDAPLVGTVPSMGGRSGFHRELRAVPGSTRSIPIGFAGETPTGDAHCPTTILHCSTTAHRMVVAACSAVMQPSAVASTRTSHCSARAVVRPFSRALATKPLVAAAAAAAPRRQQQAMVVSASAAAAAAPGQQKIRIKLKSYWVDLLQDSVEKIREAASSTGASISGPVPLPTRCVVVAAAPLPVVLVAATCAAAAATCVAVQRMATLCVWKGMQHRFPGLWQNAPHALAAAAWRRLPSRRFSPPCHPCSVPDPDPFPPRRRKIYTVLRSPHVNKDSREQFEVRVHQRLVDVKHLSSETIDKLMGLDLPAGVDIEVRGACAMGRCSCGGGGGGGAACAVRRFSRAACLAPHVH